MSFLLGSDRRRACTRIRSNQSTFSLVEAAGDFSWCHLVTAATAHVRVGRIVADLQNSVGKELMIRALHGHVDFLGGGAMSLKDEVSFI